MRDFISILILVLVVTTSCNAKTPCNKKVKKEKSKYVLVETVYGDMKIRLYNETPLHRDNFLKLVNETFYDSLLFHRVIKDFMIQGGDPNSKGAQQGKSLGQGGPGYKINAEFVPSLYHKKGALAAAREGDQVNPEKKSSGSQFYFVQGTIFSLDQLIQMEERINSPKKQKFFEEYINKPENSTFKLKLDSLSKEKAFEKLYEEVELVFEQHKPEMDSLNLFYYTDEQKDIYSNIGGTPHLDQNYTVFGEIVEGLNVIDSIATIKVDRNSRPITDVIMKMKVVKR